MNRLILFLVLLILITGCGVRYIQDTAPEPEEKEEIVEEEPIEEEEVEEEIVEEEPMTCEEWAKSLFGFLGRMLLMTLSLPGTHCF